MVALSNTISFPGIVSVSMLASCGLDFVHFFPWAQAYLRWADHLRRLCV